jgi:integrase
MSLAKRGKSYHIRFRPFGGPVIGLSTRARSKLQAREIEMAILTACRSGDYGSLPPLAREACIRLFQNQKWELPPELSGVSQPKQELTLWKAMEIFLNYPEIKTCIEKARYEMCLVHLVEHFGKDQPMKSIWVPEIKDYIAKRQDSGAAASTINREKGTLSKLFQTLVELRLTDVNPCRLVENLSQKLEERQVYLSREYVGRIAAKCPEWFESVIWTAYYSGMRRGEIMRLTRKQVNLSRRMILLGPEDTKEAHWKRIPIHLDLVPIIEACLKVTSLESDRVFLIHDKDGLRPPTLEAFKNPWPRACEALENAELLSKPFPRFHDLRHTWKSNALSSGIDPEIREAIMGHWFKGKTVTERYGRIKDGQLLKAIDSMIFDNGETEILVVSGRKKVADKKTFTRSVQTQQSKENQDAANQA